jgi:hypothetical protein
MASSPTGGQHFNGQAERMIGTLKKQMWRSFKGRKYTHEETCTILQEAAQVVNSRPLATGSWVEGDPLCPKDLMMEKNQRRNANTPVRDRAAAGEEVQGSPGSQGGILG